MNRSEFFSENGHKPTRGDVRQRTTFVSVVATENCRACSEGRQTLSHIQGASCVTRLRLENTLKVRDSAKI